MDQLHQLQRLATVQPCASMSRFKRGTTGLFAPFVPLINYRGGRSLKGSGP